LIGECEGRRASAHARPGPWDSAAGDAGFGDERRVQRLVVRAKTGDREAMWSLYVAFAPAVRGHVARFVSNREDADDVTQHTFAKLMIELPRYEPGAAPFRAWLLRVARNVAIDQARRSRTVPRAELGESDGRAGEDTVEQRASLCEALGRLTAGQRDVLVLRHLVGLTPEEIATRLGRSLRSVYCLHHRGRAIACAVLDELGSAPATAPSHRPADWGEPLALEASA